MLMVVKRLGHEEPFDGNKIRNSLAAASDELGLPLSNSDLKNICDSLVRQLEGREKVASREIYETLQLILKEEKFTSLAGAYEKYGENAWKDL